MQHRGAVPRLALSPRKTFVLLGFVIVVQTALMALFFRLAEFTAVEHTSPLNDPMLWSFAIPYATAILVMTLVADRPTALFTGFFGSLVVGFLAPRGFEFVVFSAGCFSGGSLRHRSISKPSNRHGRGRLGRRSGRGASFLPSLSRLRSSRSS